MLEEWRPIAGFPYEVSNLGRVRRTVVTHKQARNTYPGRMLKLCLNFDGYLMAYLCKDGKVYYRPVHLLICEAWHGPRPYPTAQVRHFPDRDRLNNVPDNLSWGTAQDNADDRELHGQVRRGENSPRAVLTQAQVNEIRQLHAEALKGRRRAPRGLIPQLALQFNVNKYTLTCVVQGRGYS